MLEIPREYGSQDVYYDDVYPHVVGIQTKGIFSFLARYPHKVMESPFKSNIEQSILEVGFGSGEHLPFVKDNYFRYVALDKSEKMLDRSLHGDQRLEKVIGDAQMLPFPANTFDRVVATCLLAHLDNPEVALREWARVLKNHGIMTIYLPAEPGLALRTFRLFFSRSKAESLGYKGYELFIARDHKRSLHNLLVIIREVFGTEAVKIVRRPFPFTGWYLNLFYVVHVKVEKR